MLPALLFSFSQIRTAKKDNPPNFFIKTSYKIINLISKGIVHLIRGIPLVIIILLVYCLPYPIFSIRIPIAVSGLVAITIYSSIYMSTIFASGFNAVPDELLESAKILGLNKWQILMKIQIPIAFRVMLPTFLNLFITVFKDTSILSVVGVCELTFTAKQMTTAEPVNYFLLLFLVILIYWTIATFGSALVKILENNFDRNYQLNKEVL